MSRESEKWYETGPDGRGGPRVWGVSKYRYEDEFYKYISKLITKYVQKHKLIIQLKEKMSILQSAKGIGRSIDAYKQGYIVHREMNKGIVVHFRNIDNLIKSISSENNGIYCLFFKMIMREIEVMIPNTVEFNDIKATIDKAISDAGNWCEYVHKAQIFDTNPPFGKNMFIHLQDPEPHHIFQDVCISYLRESTPNSDRSGVFKNDKGVTLYPFFFTTHSINTWSKAEIKEALSNRNIINDMKKLGTYRALKRRMEVIF